MSISMKPLAGESERQRTRPCEQHGHVVRQIEYWSSGPQWACPFCKGTEDAIDLLYERIRNCEFVDGAAVLGSSMRHLMASQQWRERAVAA